MIKKLIKKIILKFAIIIPSYRYKLYAKSEKDLVCLVHLNNKDKKWCIKHGFSYCDYYVYQLNDNNYQDYLSTNDSFIPRTINNSQFMAISDNKIIFPFVFSCWFNVLTNYASIKNNRIILTSNCFNSIEELLMSSKNKPLIIKPSYGFDGMSIGVIEYSDNVYTLFNEKYTLNELIAFIKTLDGFVIQNKIQNHQYAKDIYPESLNTIRVVSACSKNETKHRIICAVHRFGSKRSGYCDNFSKGGLSAYIDIETGSMSKVTAYDFIEDGKRLYYDKHPDTSKQVEGVTIPYWNEIKERIIKFTTDFPFYRFIAWDIAVADSGEIYVVETNMKTSLGLLQVHKPMRNEELGRIILEMKNE